MSAYADGISGAKTPTYSSSSAGPIKQVAKSALECGAVGLKNLGNTCFMASTLQCLSHTAPLTAFFLRLGRGRDGLLQPSWDFSRFLTPSNKLGWGGDVANAYAGLLRFHIFILSF